MQSYQEQQSKLGGSAKGQAVARTSGVAQVGATEIEVALRRCWPRPPESTQARIDRCPLPLRHAHPERRNNNTGCLRPMMDGRDRRWDESGLLNVSLWPLGGRFRGCRLGKLFPARVFP